MSSGGQDCCILRKDEGSGFLYSRGMATRNLRGEDTEALVWGRSAWKPHLLIGLGDEFLGPVLERMEPWLHHGSGDLGSWTHHRSWELVGLNSGCPGSLVPLW